MEKIELENVRRWKTIWSTVRVPDSFNAVCPRCNALVTFSTQKEQYDAAKPIVTQVAICPNCSDNIYVVVIREEIHPIPNAMDDSNPKEIYIYPPNTEMYHHPKFIADIPDSLRSSFQAAIDSHNSQNYTAAAVMARRTLEGVFKLILRNPNRRAALASLIDKAIEELDLVAPIRELSRAIKEGGNLGAHFDDIEPSKLMTKRMLELLEYLILYLYILPKEINKLEKEINKVN